LVTYPPLLLVVAGGHDELEAQRRQVELAVVVDVPGGLDHRMRFTAAEALEDQVRWLGHLSPHRSSGHGALNGFSAASRVEIARLS